MSVTILTARAHRLFAPVVEALGQCARKGEDVLLLVPEQFTLAAERGVMERLSLTGMFLIDVMSPSRLSEQVLAAAGRGLPAGSEDITDLYGGIELGQFARW